LARHLPEERCARGRISRIKSREGNSENGGTIEGLSSLKNASLLRRNARPFVCCHTVVHKGADPCGGRDDKDSYFVYSDLLPIACGL
jgi:hypothetical protein